MRRLVVLSVALMFLLFFAPQAEALQEEPAATREDVQRLEQEIGRMRREALEAERQSRHRSRIERQKVTEDNRAAIADAEKKLAERLESIAREARKRSDDQLRTQRIVWLVTSVAALMGLILMARFLKKSGAGSGQPERPNAALRQAPLIDPTIPELREFARQYSLGKVWFVLTLQDGRRFNCLAEIKEGFDPLVYVEKEKDPVSWDKRRQKAVQIGATKAPLIKAS